MNRLQKRKFLKVKQSFILIYINQNLQKKKKNDLLLFLDNIKTPKLSIEANNFFCGRK